jgi:parvulin-like peptidyl-prolyl isomerase
MKRTLLALALAAATPLFAQTDAHKLVARVNGEEITRGELDALWDRVPKNFRDQYANVGGKKTFLENYIGKRLLVQEALRTGFAAKVGVPEELDPQSESKLFDRYVRDVIAAPMVTEEAMRKVYDERRDEFNVPEQAKLRIIRVAKGDAPDAARDKISKAMIEVFSWRNTLAAKLPAKDVPLALADKFSEVAARVSEDPSAAEGGQLGWVGLLSLEHRIAEPARSMTPGTMSGILDLGDGYALLFVEEKYVGGTAPYEVSKDVIREYVMAQNKNLVMQAVQKKTLELRAAGKVEIFAENIE